MITRALIATGAILVLTATARAQTPSFEQVAYVTCREAQTLQPEPRKALAIFLAEHSARHRGVMIPEDGRGGELAMLVRGGCTLAPDAYLFTVIDRAILAEASKLPKRR